MPNRTKFNVEDLIGKTYGKLTVTGPLVEGRTASGKLTKSVWCKCSCGNTKLVNLYTLVRGETSSCGCLAKENYQRLGNGRRDGTIKSKGNLRHGGTHTRLFSVWTNMNTRCTNPNTEKWRYYGGKGITVCEEWSMKNDIGFENFRGWAYSNGYSENLDIELDRINTDKNYCPENCRWIPKAENRERAMYTRPISACGFELNASQWSDITGIPYHVIVNRCKKGLSDTEVIGRPLGVTGVYQHKDAIKPLVFLDKQMMDVHNIKYDRPLIDIDKLKGDIP